MQRFIEFINNLENSDNILIIHDIDLDGVVSAFLTKKALEKLKIKNIILRYHKNSEKKFTYEDYEFIKKNNINKIISVDLSTDEDLPTLRMIEDLAEILIIDHHPIINNVNSSKTTMIKASEISHINPGQYPASKMVYDLFSQVTGMKEYAWISCLGIKADSADKTWKGFIESNVKDMNNFETAEKLLTYACIDRENKGIEKALNALETSHNFKDIINKLKEYKKLDKEIEDYIYNHKKYAEIHNDIDLEIITIKSKHLIKSIVANEVSKLDVHKTIIVLQEYENIIHVAARRQDEFIDMGKLMKKITSRIPDATGGGHKAAAGARFKKEYLSKFKENLINELKKRNKK